MYVYFTLNTSVGISWKWGFFNSHNAIITSNEINIHSAISSDMKYIFNFPKCPKLSFIAYINLESNQGSNIISIFENNSPITWSESKSMSGRSILRNSTASSQQDVPLSWKSFPQLHSCPLYGIYTIKLSHILVKTFLLNVKYHRSYILTFESTL